MSVRESSFQGGGMICSLGIGLSVSASCRGRGSFKGTVYLGGVMISSVGQQ